MYSFRFIILKHLYKWASQYHWFCIILHFLKLRIIIFKFSVSAPYLRLSLPHELKIHYILYFSAMFFFLLWHCSQYKDEILNLLANDMLCKLPLGSLGLQRVVCQLNVRKRRESRSKESRFSLGSIHCHLILDTQLLVFMCS